MLLALIWFAGFAAHPADFHPDLRLKGGATMALLAGLTVHGFGIGIAGVAIHGCWWLALSAWRFADPVAITATQEGLTFHPSLFSRAIAWAEIADIALIPSRSSGDGASGVLIALKSPMRERFGLLPGRAHRIVPLDLSDGADVAFLNALPQLSGSGQLEFEQDVPGQQRSGDAEKGE